MKSIYTNQAPEAIGTYSQAIQCGNMIFLSGQIPLDPKTMQLVDEDIKIQLKQIFSNLSAVCEAAGGSLSQIVKLTVYLIDLSHFPLVNEVMNDYFNAPFPARAAIGVSALPKGAKVEIDGIMHLE